MIFYEFILFIFNIIIMIFYVLFQVIFNIITYPLWKVACFVGNIQSRNNVIGLDKIEILIESKEPEIEETVEECKKWIENYENELKDEDNDEQYKIYCRYSLEDYKNKLKSLSE